MLGNFSFGDYFKHEAIAWTWEFLTETVGLSADRLYPSVYENDDEAFEIWHKEIGIDKARIFRFGKADNFWEHGQGPCGPCSEVYYDRGEKYGCGKETCTVGCDCDRYIEVWNNVFTQFYGDGKGNYTELEQKNIDTGMGLERLAAVVQDAESIFDVDTVKTLRDNVCKFAGIEYKEDETKDVSIRVITDHVRSATFMISDGIMPSNEGRGYVLRRIIRRAARHGRILGIERMFLTELCRTVIDGSKGGYPELVDKQAFILNVLTQEEKKFYKTIDQGLLILSDMEQSIIEKSEKTLAGADAFKLYDTYGFPLDLTKEILEEKGIGVDEEGFAAEMEKQKSKARKARKETNYMGADATVYEELDPSITSVFVGYDKPADEIKHISEVLALTTESEITQALSEGDNGTIIVAETPFYAAMGGQSGDAGYIETTEGSFIVEDTIKLKGGKIGHVGVISRGMIRAGDKVTLKVDEKRRKDTCQNHSATHLLHAALRKVLGEHVEQAGSFVSRDRLRFDFSHFSAMSREEIKSVEEIVLSNIYNAAAVNIEEMPIEKARESGAMALFGEKYGETVRVVKIGDYSVELCGGTHVYNTGQIGAFKILSETGIAAGVRRIEALTGTRVFEYYNAQEAVLEKASELLKTAKGDVIPKLEGLLNERKALISENERLKNKAASEALGDIADKTEEIGGVKCVVAALKGVSANALRDLCDKLKEKSDGGAVVLLSETDGKALLIAAAGETAIGKGAHAGNLIKEIAGIVGGGGGGRANMAQAGGNNPSGIEDAVGAAWAVLRRDIN